MTDVTRVLQRLEESRNASRFADTIEYVMFNGFHRLQESRNASRFVDLDDQPVLGVFVKPRSLSFTSSFISRSPRSCRRNLVDLNSVTHRT